MGVGLSTRVGQINPALATVLIVLCDTDSGPLATTSPAERIVLRNLGKMYFWQLPNRCEAEPIR